MALRALRPITSPMPIPISRSHHRHLRVRSLRKAAAVVLTLIATGCLPAIASPRAATTPAPLRDASVLRLPQGAELMKYIVSCALPAGQSVAAPDGRQWQGEMGLAPAWRDRALNTDEQRLLSACLLARTNALGVRVGISMRAPGGAPTAHPALRTDASERRRFATFEAAFFGNLFDGEPVAYVCRGSNDAATRARLVKVRRWCALPGTEAGITRCGFVDLGVCGPETFRQHGVDYRTTAIEVHLR
jgi:hypothetical protein